MSARQTTKWNLNSMEMEYKFGLSTAIDAKKHGTKWVTRGKIMMMSKKTFQKKRVRRKDSIHWEGDYFCDCRVRNLRKWLGVKLHGQSERLNEPDQLFGKSEQLICDSLKTANKERQ